MTAKKIFLTAFILLAGNIIANAQTKSIDLDNLRYSMTYRSMPKEPFNPLFFTYSVFVNATKPTEQRVTLFEIDDATYIEGQQKVNNNEDSHLAIVVDLGNLVIKNSTVSERREERKNKEGKVINVNYYYKLVVDYAFESSYKIMQGNKVLVSNVVYAPMSTITYQSKEYGSRKDAGNFWENNRDVLISEFTNEVCRKTAAAATSRASSLYGFPITKTTDIIQTTDEKKHLENERFRAACASLKEKLNAITPNEGLKKDEVEGIIDYFQSIPSKYVDTKRADMKLRYAAYFNLCKLYLYLNEPENVHKYADLLIKNDYDKRDGEKLKKSADEWKEQLKRTKMNTRNFNPEDYFGE